MPQVLRLSEAAGKRSRWARVTIFGVALALEGHNPSFDRAPLAPRQVDTAFPSKIPQPKLPMINARERETLDRIARMYTPVELRGFREYWKRIEARIERGKQWDRMDLTVPPGYCRNEVMNGAMEDRIASTLFERGGDGKRIVEVCVALLMSQVPGETPKVYWSRRWQDIFAHEFKHLLDDERLGLDPFFTPHPQTAYIEKTRWELRQAGLFPVKYVQPDPQNDATGSIALKEAVSEIRVMLRILPEEDGTLLLEQIRDVKEGLASGNWVSAMVGEIVSRELVENGQFRQVLGIRALPPDFMGIYSRLQEVRSSLIGQSPVFRAIYAELLAQAQLAKRDGFRVQE